MNVVFISEKLIQTLQPQRPLILAVVGSICPVKYEVYNGILEPGL